MQTSPVVAAVVWTRTESGYSYTSARAKDVPREVVLAGLRELLRRYDSGEPS